MKSTLIYLYSLTIYLIYGLANVFQYFSKSISYQLKDRVHPRKITLKIAKNRSKKTSSFLFFCSSAGEYEQARPLIRCLKESHDAYVLIVFHSRSGYEFAQTRNEPCDTCLAPADTVWHWGELLAAAAPQKTFVIRYELWPAFLETSRRYSQLILVNANIPENVEPSKFKYFLRSQLLKLFDKIYLVDKDDHDYFAKSYNLGSQKLCVTGDTKFDQVMQAAKSAKTHRGDGLNARIIKTAGKRQILILGSCYKEDVDLFLSAYRNSTDIHNAWFIIFVPHQINASMTSWITGELKANNISSCIADDLPPDDSTNSVIVDKMGQLTGLYSIANIAWIGGGLHNRVHNVLEPACYGLPIAFGPRHRTSHEAIKLLSLKLAKTLNSPNEFEQWWRENTPEDRVKRERLLESMKQLCGAAQRITKDLEL